VLITALILAASCVAFETGGVVARLTTKDALPLKASVKEEVGVKLYGPGDELTNAAPGLWVAVEPFHHALLMAVTAAEALVGRLVKVTVVDTFPSPGTTARTVIESVPKRVDGLHIELVRVGRRYPFV